MQVVATAGHVDHGKSTLVRALTGMEPDRWAEERRRGMTIDLGFAWTALPSGTTVAFVDVPGHRRFVANMLAGVGPVPAVMFVVAADEGWMPQSAEHLAALDALGVRHGLLVVTRSDLADPGPARDAALAELAATTLGQVEAVCVSGATGSGIPELRAALDRLVGSLPAAVTEAPVRLWVDRAFTIRGAGTVVTGTLAAGALEVGQELELAPSGRLVTVRGLQTLRKATERVGAMARVGVNLRGLRLEDVRRGQALVTPGRWLTTDALDVRVRGCEPARLPRELVLHVGAAAVTARVRPLGRDTARLALREPLPLRIGDGALLRNPGASRIAGGVTVLDVRPPPLRRRGAAASRAALLETMDGRPDGAAELDRRGLVRRAELVAMGAEAPCAPVAGDWLVAPAVWERLRDRLRQLVAEHAEANPLEPGLPLDSARRRLDLPDSRLVSALVGPPLALRGGRILSGAGAPALPAGVEAAVGALRRELARRPFAAPEAARLAELGLDHRALTAAVRAGLLFKVAEGIYLLPMADAVAVRLLGRLPQPFTVSQARKALRTTRRVAVPLLELLARQGRTRRLPDGSHHVLTGARPGAAATSPAAPTAATRR